MNATELDIKARVFNDICSSLTRAGIPYPEHLLWWDTPVYGWAGRTPRQAWEDEDFASLYELVESL